MMEIFEGGSEQLSVQSELVLVDFLLFATGLPLGIAIKSRLVARLLRVGQRVDLGLWVDSAFLLFLLLFFLHALALVFERLFMPSRHLKAESSLSRSWLLRSEWTMSVLI